MTAGEPLVRIHGLVVSSPVRLAGQVVTGDPTPDVELIVRRGRPPATTPTSTRPAGLVLSRVCDPASGRRYSLTQQSWGWSLLFDGTARVAIARASAQVVVTAAPGVSDATLSVLLAGPTLVAVSLLRGRVLLHASAVSTDGGVIAFLGPPGAGKSSLAWLVARAAGSLFSDDALRVDTGTPTAGCVRVHRGTTAPRLRRRTWITSLLPAGVRDEPGPRTSADGRVLPDAGGSAPDTGRLAVLAVPRLSVEVDRLRVVPLPPLSALLHLATACALDGVRDAALLRTQFEAAGRIVEDVPVVALDVPWGRGPADDRLGRQIAHLLLPAAGATGCRSSIAATRG